MKTNKFQYIGLLLLSFLSIARCCLGRPWEVCSLSLHEKRLVLHMVEGYCRYELSDEKLAWLKKSPKNFPDYPLINEHFSVNSVSYSNYLKTVQSFSVWSGVGSVTNRYALVLHKLKKEESAEDNHSFGIYLNLNTGAMGLEPKDIWAVEPRWFPALLRNFYSGHEKLWLKIHSFAPSDKSSNLSHPSKVRSANVSEDVQVEVIIDDNLLSGKDLGIH